LNQSEEKSERALNDLSFLSSNPQLLHLMLHYISFFKWDWTM